MEAESFLAAQTHERTAAVDEELLGVWVPHRRSSVMSWGHLAGVVCRDGGILFRPFGYYDDRDVGVDVIMEVGLYSILKGGAPLR